MKLFEVYPLFDINIVKGRGCKVWDSKGEEYLDLYGGHAVISVGHCHPYYIEALYEQSKKLGFYSNSVINELQSVLAEKLGKVSGYPDYNLFLINSGAEANENAIKLASFHTGRRKVISFCKSFHGRTSAAVEATDNEKIKAPVNITGNYIFLELNDLDSVREELEKGNVAAVIIEGIQGVGGIRVPDDSFMVELRNLTKQYGTVLILDEVQSGYGRTGRFFAHQWTGIRPDMITVAKGMGNGFPIGGVLISPEFKAVYGQLGTTFGGNHLACAAACAVLDIIEKENLIENALETGQYLIENLKDMSQISEVRGRGLMIGFETGEETVELRKNLIYKKRIFTGASGKNVVRLLPPLVLKKEECDIFLESLKDLIK